MNNKLLEMKDEEVEATVSEINEMYNNLLSDIKKLGLNGSVMFIHVAQKAFENDVSDILKSRR